MDAVDLERIGLNRNEAKVYLALIIRGQATASELVKAIGVHRNIVYDNLEKLIEKGLVSFIVDGAKRKFIAQDPAAIIDYLQSKKLQIDRDIALAAKMAPSINKLLSSSDAQQDATICGGASRRIPAHGPRGRSAKWRKVRRRPGEIGLLRRDIRNYAIR